MANHKLQISDEERRLRRAEQLRKASYRCPVCGFCYQAKTGVMALCGRCMYSKMDTPPVEGQMGMFSCIAVHDYVPVMVEAPAPATTMLTPPEAAGEDQAEPETSAAALGTAGGG
jgi:hypothetical protein